LPYITKDRREIVDPEITVLVEKLRQLGLGDVVYVLYRLLKELYGNTRNFYTKAQALAALESTRAEYYRRVLAPYEDEKITQSGDI
jgi:hypothetical protein